MNCPYSYASAGPPLEVILSFNLDGLRWSSGRASRDVLLQLGHIEDIVDLLEPALEVKSSMPSFLCAPLP